MSNNCGILTDNGQRKDGLLNSIDTAGESVLGKAMFKVYLLDTYIRISQYNPTANQIFTKAIYNPSHKCRYSTPIIEYGHFKSMLTQHNKGPL